MPLATVALVAATVVVLAFLEYRWTMDLGTAERERLRRSLDVSAEQAHSRLERVLTDVAASVEIDDNGKVDWARSAGISQQLARALYRARGEKLERFDPSTRIWAEVGWPEELTRVRLRPPPGRPRRPEGPPEDGGPGGPEPPRPEGPGGNPGVWILQEDVPALVHPGRQEVLILTLDGDVLWSRIVPDIVQHDFDLNEFAVAVYSRSMAGTPLYETNPSVREHADFVQGFLPERGVPPLRGPGQVPGARPRRGQSNLVMPTLELRARHVRGSLESAARDLIWRNLALGFGTLVLLAGAMAAMILTTQRAQRLAAMQLDFVAGISHELRTPLAVISSAAENLADGVVAQNPQVKQYGGLIRKEARHLTSLIEDTLAFAAQRSQAKPAPLEVVDVRDVVGNTVSRSESEARSAGVKLEANLGPVPLRAKTNPAALSRCLQNLISNAVKYGGDARWVGIEGVRKEGEVQVTVRDRGPGISDQDMPHIFDPFYRGQNAAFSARGTGLGLNLVKSLMEETKGRVSVESSNLGSAFTLHLPAEEA